MVGSPWPISKSRPLNYLVAVGFVTRMWNVDPYLLSMVSIGCGLGECVGTDYCPG
jgi:hypothetical protein